MAGVPAAAGSSVEPVLSAVDVSMAFSGFQVLKNVDVAVPPGSIVGLIGPNGAGKSTLLAILSGLLRPVSGDVVLAGSRVTRKPAHYRAGLGLSRTYQRVELFTELTVREHLVISYRCGNGRLSYWRDLLAFRRPRPSEGELETVEQLLERLGLLNVADVLVAELPLGTARLVEVGRALAASPRVLLMDEPTSGLDQGERRQLVEAISQLRTQTGLAVLLVEHDVDVIFSTCDTIVALDFGNVIAVGTPEEIRLHEGVQAAYLGTAK